MAGQTLWDQLIAGAGDAIADIREKLVEEPWYGRPLGMPQSTVDLQSSEHNFEQRQPIQDNDTSSAHEVGL